MNQERYYPLYLFVLSAIVFLTGLGSHDFWAPVEPRYGEIARVMFLKNEWIVPTVNGQLYTDKPILYFWLVQIFSKAAGGVTEWTVRLPAALGAIGMVLTTFKIGKQFFTPRIGLVAAAVIATSARVIWEGRWAHLDTLFTFFFSLSMYFAARATLERKNRNQFLLAYGCMALATLTKGLIGVVLPALILIFFVLIRRDWRLIAEAKLPSGIAVFLLIAAPWFFLVSQATGGQWLSDFIFVHHIQRYTAGVGHREPVYYYLKTLPLDFLPWTIVCIPALFSYAIDLKSLRQPQRLFFVLWFAAVFVFFTASDTKRDLYLLPLFPPLGLFVGNYIEDLAAGRLPREVLFRWILAIVFALGGLACLSAPIFVWFKYREGFFACLPFACVVGAGSLWVVFMALRRSPRAVCAAICMMMALGVAVAGGWLLPFVDRFKSPRTVADEVRRRIAPNAPLYIYTDSMHDYNFYLARESIPVIPSAAELKKLRDANAPGYLLIKQKDLREAALEPQDEMRLNRGAPASRAWYLVPLRAISQ